LKPFQFPERLFQTLSGEKRNIVAFDDLACDIPTVRYQAELQFAPVLLRFQPHVGNEFCGLSDADRQDARGQGIERPRVPHASGRNQLLQPSNSIEGRDAGRLVHQVYTGRMPLGPIVQKSIPPVRAKPLCL